MVKDLTDKPFSRRTGLKALIGIGAAAGAETLLSACGASTSSKADVDPTQTPSRETFVPYVPDVKVAKTDAANRDKLAAMTTPDQITVAFSIPQDAVTGEMQILESYNWNVVSYMLSGDTEAEMAACAGSIDDFVNYTDRKYTDPAMAGMQIKGTNNPGQTQTIRYAAYLARGMQVSKDGRYEMSRKVTSFNLTSGSFAKGKFTADSTIEIQDNLKGSQFFTDIEKTQPGSLAPVAGIESASETWVLIDGEWKVESRTSTIALAAQQKS